MPLSLTAKIQATNTLLVPYANALTAAGVTPANVNAFIADVVNLLNTGYNSTNPALLIQQINDLANKGWTVILPKQAAISDGQTDVPGKDIQIVAPANLSTTQSIAVAANQFVNTLAYEIGHAENPVLNTKEYVDDIHHKADNALAVGAQVAEDLLSEAMALYNQITAQKQGIPITALSDPDAQVDETNFYTIPLRALEFGASDAAQGQSTITNQNILSYYWGNDLLQSGLTTSNTNPTLLEVMASMVMGTEGNTVKFSQDTNTNAITMEIDFANSGSGNNTVEVNGSSKTVSSFIDTFNGYGAISPSGITGGQGAPALIDPTIGSATAEQIFNFTSGDSVVDIYNPTVDNAVAGKPALTGIAEEIVGYSGTSGSGSAISNPIYIPIDGTHASVDDNSDPLTINTAATGMDTVTYISSTQNVSYTTYEIDASNASATVASNTNAKFTGTNNTITLGSNDNITVAAAAGATSLSDTFNAASGANLSTDTLTFEGNSIAGAIDPSTFDKFGRSYTLTGTTLTITGKTGGDQLTINNFVNGDFGVTLPYTFTPFTVPGASSVDLRGISSNGKLLAGTDSNGAFSDNGGTFTTIAVPASGQPNYLNPGYFHPAGVNDSGEIVGRGGILQADFLTPTAFTYNGGVFSQLHDPNAYGNHGAGPDVLADTQVSAINDKGAIVGNYTDSSHVAHGFVDNGGTFTNVTAPGGLNASVAGINNNGVIVGDYVDSSGVEHGFVDNAGTFTNVDAPNAAGSVGMNVTGINDSGVIVGYYSDSSNVVHGFVDTGGVFTTVNAPGGGNTYIYGISDSGEIVGDDATGAFTAVLQTPLMPRQAIDQSSGAPDIANATDAAVYGNGNNVTGGNNDNISAYGNGNRITAGAGSTVSLDGDDNTAAAAVTGAIINTSAESVSSVVTVAGADSAVTSSGTSDTLNLNGAADNATVNGNGSTVNLNGGGDAVNVVGNNDTVYDHGTGSGSITLHSYSNNAIVYGNASAVTDYGVYNNVSLNGVGETATLNANGDVGTLLGGNANVYVQGSGTSVFDEGTGGNVTHLTGSTDAGNIYTNNNTAIAGGSNETIQLSGNYDTGAIYGTSDVTTIFGGNDTATVAGSGSTAFDLGTGGSTITLSAANDTGNVYANNSVAFANGSGGTVWLIGNGDIATVTGTGNTANIASGHTDDTVNITGTGVSVYDESAGGNTFVFGGGSTAASATVIGGEGVENYKFLSNFGNDVLSFNGENISASTVNFGAGVTNQNLWFQHVGNDLQIDLLGTNESVTISYWFGSANAQVKNISLAGGGTLANAQVQNLVSYMAAYMSANPSFNPATATQMPTSTLLQAEITAAWTSSKIALSDTAANIAAELNSLQSLAANGTLGSITLTDSTIPTLSITSAQLTNDAGALAAITSAYNLSVSGVLAASAATVAANTHVTSIAVSDTAANVTTNLATLQTLSAKLSSITLTDGSTPTLSLSATQLTADSAALGKITSAYNLTVTAVTAANAATVATNTHVTSIKISDTAANVVANIAALQTLGTKLTSIALTDSGTPTLSITGSQFTSDATAIGKITTAYNLAVTSVLSVNAATVGANAHVTSITISDTGANVAANIAALQALGTKLTSITLTDTSTPTLSITGSQFTSDATALVKITSAYNLAVTAVTAASAATVGANTHVTSIKISDTGANVVTNIAALQALGTKLSSIALTDSGTPTLSITGAQFTSDATAIGKITTAYNLAVTSVLSSNAATVGANTHVTSIKISDTGANVATNIAALQALGSKLTSIALTDTSTPTLSLTAAQLTADATALGKITSAYNLSISAVTAANAATVGTNTHVTVITVSDTGVNVATNIAALQALGTKLTTITLTDGSTPTLSITGAQFTSDATALGKITSAYNLSVSAVTGANAATVGANTHVTSIAVSDTATNVVTNIAALQALGTKLTSIALTNGGTPTLSITGAQFTSDATAISKITSAYSLAVSAVTAANAAMVGANTHVTSIAISDTAANVTTNIAALQALGTKLTSIALTDSGTPTLSITGAQFTADATAIGKITTAYNLSVSAVTAANAATVGANTHVTAITLSDTSANVLTNLAALQTLATGTKLSSITLTDSSTPRLTLTASQLINDHTALGKIISAYHESVTADANTTETLAATAGATSNTISFASETQGVTVNLSTGSATTVHSGTTYTDTLSNFQNVTGSTFADTLTAGAGGAVLTGNGGADTYVLNAAGIDVAKDTAANLNGTTIKNFTTLDGIDLTSIAFGAQTTLGFIENGGNTAGTLTISDGTHNASVLLLGQYTAASFQKVSDGGTGTLVAMAGTTNLTAILAAAHG